MLSQEEIEATYSRKNIRKLILADIDKQADVFIDCIRIVEAYRIKPYYASKQERVAKLALDSESVVVELFAAILTKSDMNPIQAIATQMGNRLGYQYIIDGIKTAAEIVAICEVSGLYTLYHADHPDNETSTLGVLPHYGLGKETKGSIDKTTFPIPMVSKPTEWLSSHRREQLGERKEKLQGFMKLIDSETMDQMDLAQWRSYQKKIEHIDKTLANPNVGGGYLMDSSSCILGTINHHNHYLNLDALNTLQSIEWCFNDFIVGLGELPNKPLITSDQQAQFTQFKEEAIEIRKVLQENGEKFQFRWDYDSRGRSYSRGYHVNLQSTEFQKASIEFYKKEVIEL